ncbi:lipopolysaccharide biosynthesis protein [Pseudomonas japonica]|uniref:lipopolysaccharide biosynthesis protein n=1 Tax=Pseudomonas japonica TaxID=256466 RepID=UPI00382EFC44
MSEGNGFLKKLALYVPVKLLPALLTVGFIFFLYRYFSADDYVAYSVSLSCSLIVAQLSAMWVANSFVYYYSGVKEKSQFFFHCLILIMCIAPLSSLLAAYAAGIFSGAEGAFGSVWWLCAAQMGFFFMSSVCQAAFLVRQQLLAVSVQVLAQVGLAFLFMSADGISYLQAMTALTVGYGAAAAIMLIAFLARCGRFELQGIAGVKHDIRLVYEYGAPLAPWMLGMLVMAAADRFAIGYLGIESGDSYLSLKDLFVGAGGLLSMPLLMLVHPLIIKRFRDGVFEGSLIQNSIGFLIIVFSLLWALIAFVGLEIFERFTGKPVTAPMGALLVAYIGVFLNCSAVYVQKRLEVHRRMRKLAILSVVCALASVVFAYVGGLFIGLYGTALGVLLGQFAYFVLVGQTVLKKVSFYKGIVRPLGVSLLAVLLGYLLHLVLVITLDEAWWAIVTAWILVFAVLSLLVMWKGIAWREFAGAKLA